MKGLTEVLGARLFGVSGMNVYAVLDGASIPSLLETLHREEPEHECLYRGELPPDLAETAPYLVRLERGAGFSDWVLEQGWGNHWGIFALSGADLRTVRKHFRTFLIVHEEDGKPLYFRYYDPRVLRSYLPTCNSQELGTVFGPVACYVAEGAEPGVLLKYQLAKGALVERQEKL